MGASAVKAEVTMGLRNWVRGRNGFIVSFVVPIVLLVALGLTFDGADPPADVRVEDLAGTPESVRLAGLLGERAALALGPASLPPETDGAAWLAREGADALVRIPAGFGAPDAPPVVLVLGPDAQRAALVEDALAAALARLSGAQEGAVRVERLAADPGAMAYSSFVLPGVIGLTILTIGLFSAFGSVVRLRQQGLLARLAVSPMTKGEWVLGRMLAQALAALAVTAVLVLVAVVVFRTPVHLSPVTLLLVAAGTVVFSGVGTILGGMVRDPESGRPALNLVYLPLLLVSGSFFDTSTLPAAVRWLPKLSPLTYVNDGLRQDLILGRSWDALAPAGILVAMAAALVLVGARLIDWSEKG